MDISQQYLDAIPFNRFIGIEIIELAGESVTLRLPMRPELGNHVGTMHAAAQYALGEAATGALNILALGDLIERAVPLNAKAQIDYRRPSFGGLTARATVTPEELTRVRTEFTERGRTRFSTQAKLSDEHDTVVTIVTIEWVILTRPTS